MATPFRKKIEIIFSNKRKIQLDLPTLFTYLLIGRCEPDFTELHDEDVVSVLPNGHLVGKRVRVIALRLIEDLVLRNDASYQQVFPVIRRDTFRQRVSLVADPVYVRVFVPAAVHCPNHFANGFYLRH